MVKRNVCVFISGSGTNLKALIKRSREYNFPINITYIVSNSRKAKGLDIAKLYKIPFYVFNSNKKINLEFFLNDLRNRNISLICLAGYMKILSKQFINKFNKKIINIHPSLLPKYKGLNTFKRALDNKEQLTGCTVHYVNEKLDAGKIILKKKINIMQSDNENTLKSKVQSKEYFAYSESIINIFRKN
jgi:phosphoribosylglycinamide formyltransferase 1